MFHNKKIYLLLIVFLFAAGTFNAYADINREKKEKDKGDDQIQRASTGLYDNQKNTVSKFQFFTSNYGIFGNDVVNGVGGGYWPRGSLNQYIFGGGIWFGAQKIRPDVTDSAVFKKYVEVTYNPNNGRSWFVPGKYDPANAFALSDAASIKKYRTYFSTDFRSGDGIPRNLNDGPNWPIWDASTNLVDSLKTNRYFGYYVDDETARNKTVYPKGPAFISGEDIFAIYKDTDLNQFDGGAGRRKTEGYPLTLQVEQTIFSWGFGDYANFVFLCYKTINKSQDTLRNCWTAPVMDPDIALAPNTATGAQNDRAKFYEDDLSLNLAVVWTNTNAAAEKGHGFGYLGFDFLESPAVDEFGNVRRDKAVYPVSQQLGMKTFRVWAITEDISEDEPRYDYISAGVRDGDNGPADKRLLMATGPFNMLPGDTVRVVLGIILANTALGKDADGTKQDMAELVRRDIFAQAVYDDNFRAPTPPDRASLYWEPRNNGVRVYWDSTSEISSDLYENGLDFLGYRLFRARRTDLDTFNVDNITPNNTFNSGAGPFGWKQLAQWSIPTPFQKSAYRSGTNQTDITMPLIDSLRILGPVYRNDTLDLFEVRMMKVGEGLVLLPDAIAGSLVITQGTYIPVIVSLDTSNLVNPWGTFFSQKNTDPFPITWFYQNPPQGRYLFDSVLVGTIDIGRRDSSAENYNPFLWKRTTDSYASVAAATGMPDGKIGIDKVLYIKSSIRTQTVGGVTTALMDKVTLLDPMAALRDSTHMKAALIKLYSYLQNGQAKATFPDFEGSQNSRNIITHYMDSITNHRTFVDIGDDNQDGVIDFNIDPSKTEKMINNVDYYYKLLAYDEGDWNQQTNNKINDASPGLPNLVDAIPNAARVGDQVKFQITYVDTNLIGGLYNFNFYAIDYDRVIQQYGDGRELELKFEPDWNQLQITETGPSNQTPPPTKPFIGFYKRKLTITDLKTGELVYSGNTYLEPDNCNLPLYGTFSEDAWSYYQKDALIDTLSGKSINFGVWNNKGEYIRQGQFTTGNFDTPYFCYDRLYVPYDIPWGGMFSSSAYGALGFTFDYTIKQRGGEYRGDSAYIVQASPNVSTPLSFLPPDNVTLTDTTYDRKDVTDRVLTTQKVDVIYYRHNYDTYQGIDFLASFNNGPGNYLVTFQDGGQEDISVIWGKSGSTATPKTKTFKANYLTVNVSNKISYNRPVTVYDSIPVTYPKPLDFMEIPDSSGLPTVSDNLITGGYEQRYYIDPRNLRIKSNEFINKFNIASYGWVDARHASPFTLKNQFAYPADARKKWDSTQTTNVGTQGRYYTTAISSDGVDTLDFVNVLQVGGVFFTFDYANIGWMLPQGSYMYSKIGPVAGYTAKEDFKSGDQVMLKTDGGALGYPLPGATVRFRINSNQTANPTYTDPVMDQIKVIPNPYYVSHEGQKSPYDEKIYFTKLPKKCTIDIYTVNGELVRSLNHDETSPETTREAVEIWNLMTSNNQRAQSQTLVAVIKTPDGAQSVKNFSIIVGSYRLVTE